MAGNQAVQCPSKKRDRYLPFSSEHPHPHRRTGTPWRTSLSRAAESETAIWHRNYPCRRPGWVRVGTGEEGEGTPDHQHTASTASCQVRAAAHKTRGLKNRTLTGKWGRVLVPARSPESGGPPRVSGEAAAGTPSPPPLSSRSELGLSRPRDTGR